MATDQSNAAPDPWRAGIHRQAYVAVEVAATQAVAAQRTLAYYLRLAMSHGLTIDEACAASGMPRERVLELTDPAVAA